MVTDKQIANLVPLDKRSPEERREIASLGAKAAAEAKRENSRLRKATQAILDSKLSTGNKIREEMAAAGISEENMTVAMGMAFSMMKQAVEKGNVRAFLALRDTSGEVPSIDITSDGDQIQGLVIGFRSEKAGDDGKEQ